MLHIRELERRGRLGLEQVTRLIPQRGDSIKVNPMDPAKENFPTRKPGVTPRIGSSGSILHITSFLEVTELPEGGHTIGHHFLR